MNKDLAANLALIVSALVGLQMLWTKLAEVRVNRENKREIDQTTLLGKQVDDAASWRKDLLADLANTRLELREAQRMIGEGQHRCAERIEEAIDKLQRIALQLEHASPVLEPGELG